LLGLFAVQLVTKLPTFSAIHTEARIGIGIVYLALTAAILVRQRRAVAPLMHEGLRAEVPA
jgi:hypothetical protein